MTSKKFVIHFTKVDQDIYWAGWLEMVNGAWVGSMRSEFFFTNKIYHFSRLFYKLPFYLGNLLHIISFSFSLFCIFQNSILHKLLKLGFWNFKPIFSECSFHWLQHFFPLPLATCLSWYLHLQLSHGFLTFLSFNIWR